MKCLLDGEAYVTLCLILLAYWLGMFIVSWMHDREIEKERKIQGQQAADALVSRFERLKDLKEKNAHVNFVPQDYGEVKRAVDGYNRQRLRTKKAEGGEFNPSTQRLGSA